MKEKIAIVTTLRDAGKVLDSFIKYHNAIGFDHFFLFFDDPGDPSIGEARKYPNVTAIPNDIYLQDEWRSKKTYGKMAPFICDHVMARQVLNAETALGLAMGKDMDWLLHIDIDELFYLPAQTLQAHLRSLSASATHCISYPNHEAVPERVDIDDFFREVTLFKTNAWTLIEQSSRCPFLFYNCGKSAVRLSDKIVPLGVHHFVLPEEQYLLYRRLLWRFWSRRETFGVTKPQQPFLKRLRRGVRRGPLFSRDAATRPVILHYPCCGFQHLWNKYTTRGRFPDLWWNTIKISEVLPFHLGARDVVVSGDRHAARAFYAERIMMRDGERIQRHLADGLLCRILEPSRLLAGTSSDVDAGRER